MRSERIHPPFTGAIALLMALALPLTPAAAHDLWIEPSDPCAEAGQRVDLAIAIGHGTESEPKARLAEQIVRFEVIDGSGTSREVPGVEGMVPAGILPGAPSPGVAVYETGTFPIELDAETFGSYLEEEGLERVIRWRAEAGASGSPGRELYSRSVKSLLGGCAGDAAETSGTPEAAAHPHLRPTGLTLELVPDTLPQSLPPGRDLTLTLLYRGEPLPDILVEASRREAPEEAQRLRTDSRGRVTIRPDAPGFWIAAAVHMDRHDGSGPDEADWRSHWTSLTFTVPGR